VKLVFNGYQSHFSQRTNWSILLIKFNKFYSLRALNFSLRRAFDQPGSNLRFSPQDYFVLDSWPNLRYT